MNENMNGKNYHLSISTDFPSLFSAAKRVRAVYFPSVFSHFLSLEPWMSTNSLLFSQIKNWILLVVLCRFWGDCWLRWCPVYLKQTASKKRGEGGLSNFIFLLYRGEIWGWYDYRWSSLASEIWDRPRTCDFLFGIIVMYWII